MIVLITYCLRALNQKSWVSRVSYILIPPRCHLNQMIWRVATSCVKDVPKNMATFCIELCIENQRVRVPCFAVAPEKSTSVSTFRGQLCHVIFLENDSNNSGLWLWQFSSFFSKIFSWWILKRDMKKSPNSQFINDVKTISSIQTFHASNLLFKFVPMPQLCLGVPYDWMNLIILHQPPNSGNQRIHRTARVPDFPWHSIGKPFNTAILTVSKNIIGDAARLVFCNISIHKWPFYHKANNANSKVLINKSDAKWLP